MLCREREGMRSVVKKVLMIFLLKIRYFHGITVFVALKRILSDWDIIYCSLNIKITLLSQKYWEFLFFIYNKNFSHYELLNYGLGKSHINYFMIKLEWTQN